MVKYILEHPCYVILNLVKYNTCKVMQEGLRNSRVTLYLPICTATKRVLSVSLIGDGLQLTKAAVCVRVCAE